MKRYHMRQLINSLKSIWFKIARSLGLSSSPLKSDTSSQQPPPSTPKLKTVSVGYEISTTQLQMAYSRLQRQFLRDWERELSNSLLASLSSQTTTLNPSSQADKLWQTMLQNELESGLTSVDFVRLARRYAVAKSNTPVLFPFSKNGSPTYD